MVHIFLVDNVKVCLLLTNKLVKLKQLLRPLLELELLYAIGFSIAKIKVSVFCMVLKAFLFISQYFDFSLMSHVSRRFRCLCAREYSLKGHL